MDRGAVPATLSAKRSAPERCRRRPWAVSALSIEAVVPPHRLGQIVGDRAGLRMDQIDEDVGLDPCRDRRHQQDRRTPLFVPCLAVMLADILRPGVPARMRSEEHTSELQSLMRISSAVFCLQKTTTIRLTTSPL